MRVFSGIKPTGEATLGTILGAIKPWTEMQGPEAFFCIVDLHALTVPQDPAQLRELTYDIAATFIAVGIDPGRTNMFIQGQVSAHRELAWLLECTATFGELQRMTQFKDKSRKNVSVSAACSPTLCSWQPISCSTRLRPFPSATTRFSMSN